MQGGGVQKVADASLGNVLLPTLPSNQSAAWILPKSEISATWEYPVCFWDGDGHVFTSQRQSEGIAG